LRAAYVGAQPFARFEPRRVRNIALNSQVWKLIKQQNQIRIIQKLTCGKPTLFQQRKHTKLFVISLKVSRDERKKNIM
jgi:hypothetical protein